MSSISTWSSRLTRRKGQWLIDEGLLRSLIPLNLLDGTELKSLTAKARVLNITAGARIDRGAGRRSTVYVLSGIVEVLSAGEVTSIVAAGTEASRHPLLSASSGDAWARAKMDAAVLEVDIDTDELVFHSGNASDYEVSDIGAATGTDWLTRFLQAKVFMRLPPSNIQRLISQMEEVEVTAGQVIMRQDETDDYYYIVKEGVCRVTTRDPSGGGDIHLTDLREGDGFGEDALITNGRRGATVTMVNEGRLMRLVKEDFTALLVEPVLKYVSRDEVQALLKDGAILLDVRQPQEFARDGAGHGVNIPLSLLRSKAHELDAGRLHITVSNVLNRSSAAAFLLCQQGMDVCILRDGAQALTSAGAEGTPSLRVVRGGAGGGDSQAAVRTGPVPPARREAPATAQAVAAASPKPRPEPTMPSESGNEEELTGRLASLQRQLDQEVERRTEAVRRVKLRDGQLRELQGQLDDSRVKLKKILALARTAEGKRRETQARLERLQSQHAAAQRKAAEGERKLAENEALRLKLERAVTVLRAQQPAPTPGAAQRGAVPPAPRAGASPPSVPAPVPSAAPSRSGGVLRYAAWVLFLAALLGATSVVLYDMATKQREASRASREYSESPGTSARRVPAVSSSSAAGRPGRSTPVAVPARDRQALRSPVRVGSRP